MFYESKVMGNCLWYRLSPKGYWRLKPLSGEASVFSQVMTEEINKPPSLKG